MDVLTGTYNPSGRLPMSFPYNVGQLPMSYNHYSSGRPKPEGSRGDYNCRYLDAPSEPLYPFGYGLSYTSMPDQASAFTATGNPNNYLNTLSVTGQTLTPGFTGATTSYSLVVDNSVESIKVNATAVASTSTVSGTGTVSLKVGSNTVSVKCKSQSGSTKTYKLTVVRQEGEEASKVPTSKTYTVGSKYITGIQPGTKASTVLKNLTASGATLKLVGTDGKKKSGKRLSVGR